jgi:hypothetical protein
LNSDIRRNDRALSIAYHKYIKLLDEALALDSTKYTNTAQDKPFGYAQDKL